MILFNCKTAKNPQHRKLAVEYGEFFFEYEGARFMDLEIIDLFRRMQRYNETEFIDALRWLQPEKRWTARKERYWFNEGVPIRGVLASLLGKMTEKTGDRRAETADYQDVRTQTYPLCTSAVDRRSETIHHAPRVAA